MREDYLKNARAVIEDGNILVNLVSQRVKQLNRGSRPLVESLEKLSATDIALREIAEGRISYELPLPKIVETADLPASRVWPAAFVPAPATLAAANPAVPR